MVSWDEPTSSIEYAHCTRTNSYMTVALYPRLLAPAFDACFPSVSSLVINQFETLIIARFLPASTNSCHNNTTMCMPIDGVLLYWQLDIGNKHGTQRYKRTLIHMQKLYCVGCWWLSLLISCCGNRDNQSIFMKYLSHVPIFLRSVLKWMFLSINMCQSPCMPIFVCSQVADHIKNGGPDTK